jgi:4a-hydroxytetrahydrobiopterin dehydratase
LPQAQLKLLTPGEIKVFLGELNPVRNSPPKGSSSAGVISNEVKHWEFLETQKIVKEFIFNDFSQAMKFVNQVAELAEKEGHHPDIAIHYNKVEIILWTHFVKGLSINDFILAVKIDNL